MVAALDTFEVAVDTDEGQTSFTHTDWTDVPIPADTGQVIPVDGSGTLEITSAVEVDSTRDYVVKYTAATSFENGYLIVALPNDLSNDPPVPFFDG